MTDRRLIAVVFVALSVFSIVALLSVPYPPMVDVPQHAAQISAWQRMSDPASFEAQRFVLNLRTPYLTGYALAHALAPLIGVVPALKLVFGLAIVAHGVAFWVLVRKLGHPSWLGWLGIPLGTGYAFYFGFVSFVVAMPLVLFSISAALEHRDDPTVRSGLVLALLLCVTLVAHGIGLAFAMGLAAPLLLRGNGSFVSRVAPLVAPVLIYAIWIAPSNSVRSIGATIWAPRLLELLAAPGLLFASSGVDRVAVVFGYAVIGLTVLSFGRVTRSAERFVPLVIVLVGFCLFPLSLVGFGPLHPRFAAFLLPALLILFEPRGEPRPWRLPAFALAFCTCWCVVFGVRLSMFAREMRPIGDFVASMPAGLRIRPIVFERESESFPGLPALLHASAYYAVAKGGVQGYSFAMYPTSVVRYRPSVEPGMGGGAEWHPENFSIESEFEKYDCFLVHSTADVSERLFGKRRSDLALDFHEESWWAYRVRSVTAAGDRT